MAVQRAFQIVESHEVFGHTRKQPKMFRAGLYARVSTNDQQTLPMQSRHGWTAVGIFRVQKGHPSGAGTRWSGPCPAQRKRLGRPMTAGLHTAKIRKLHRAGISQSEIARRLQIGRTVIRRILADLFPRQCPLRRPSYRWWWALAASLITLLKPPLASGCASGDTRNSSHVYAFVVHRCLQETNKRRKQVGKTQMRGLPGLFTQPCRKLTLLRDGGRGAVLLHH
jgi:hypothetical protein